LAVLFFLSPKLYDALNHVEDISFALYVGMSMVIR